MLTTRQEARGRIFTESRKRNSAILNQKIHGDIDMKKMLIMLAALGMMCSAGVGAVVDKDTEWAGEFDSWTTNDSNLTGSPHGTLEEGTSGDGWLKITAGDPGGSVAEDYIFSDSTLAGSSNYNTAGIQSVNMDFYSESNTGYSLSWYFLSGTDTWLADVSGSSTGWRRLVRNFNFGSGWYNVSGSTDSTTFDSSLGDVDEIGILLTYEDNVGGQVYGIDDFQLQDVEQIPGPQTWMLLGFTFMSLGITFRDKLKFSVHKFLS